MRFSYTPEHLAFLTKQYKKLGVKQLTQAFNKKFNLDKKHGHIKSALTNHKITSGRTAGAILKGIPRVFTLAQIKFIEKAYQKNEVSIVTEMVNKKYNTCFAKSQIVRIIKNRGITCPRTGQFKKGGTTWNKGTKGLTKSNRTSYKKGCIPVNHREVGSQRINNDGYIEIKVAEPRVWKLLQRHVWEQHNGQLLPNINIRFKDSNPFNCAIENLEPVDKYLHLKLNLCNYKNMPEEVKPVAMNVAKLETKIHQLKSKSTERKAG